MNGPFVALTRADFDQARAIVAPYIYNTPLLSSRLLSERTGFDVRLKAELFQKRAPTRSAGR